jgi:hypothetical protein
MYGQQDMKKMFLLLAALTEYSVPLQQIKGNPIFAFPCQHSTVLYYWQPYVRKQNKTNKKKKRKRFVAFPWQQRLRESATMLRHTYIAYLAVGLLRPSSVPPGK